MHDGNNDDDDIIKLFSIPYISDRIIHALELKKKKNSLALISISGSLNVSSFKRNHEQNKDMRPGYFAIFTPNSDSHP